MLKEIKLLPNNKKLIISNFKEISIPKTKYKRYTNKTKNKNNKRINRLFINTYQNTASSFLDNSKQELINTIKNFITETNEESYNSISKYNTSPSHRTLGKIGNHSVLKKSQKEKYAKKMLYKNDESNNKNQSLTKSYNSFTNNSKINKNRVKNILGDSIKNSLFGNIGSISINNNNNNYTFTDNNSYDYEYENEIEKKNKKNRIIKYKN